MVGSKEAIGEILQAAEGKDRVAVHWERDDPADPYWSAVIGPAEEGPIVSSIDRRELLGKWREVGRVATLEFLEDGGFKAVDNEGMAVAGRYTLIGDGTLTFAIRHDGSEDEIVRLHFSLIGGELTLTPADGGGAEHYRKGE